MTFNETMECFLKERKEGKLYDSSIITYKRKLEVFFEFLIISCGVGDNNYQDILRGNNIKNSIFDSTQEFIILRTSVDNKIKDLKLDKSTQKSPIMEDAFNELNEYCNFKIDTSNLEQIINNNDHNKPLVDFISENGG